MIKRERYDISQNSLIEYAYSDWITSDTWWTLWECSSTNFDYEKLVLCEVDTGNKVLVESWTDTSDPTQARTTRYTYLATNLPFTWNADTDLSDCGWEKVDIQTKQYCDTWETVFGTLVFDVSWAVAVLIGIVFHKTDWSVHTPVNPIEWACVADTSRIVNTTSCGWTIVPVTVEWLAKESIVTNTVSTKECNSDDILTALETIVANTTTSNTNEASIITELQLIKAQTIAINWNTDNIETKLDTLISDQLAWNLSLTDIKNTLLNDILPELQDINANTDTVEALITSTNIKLDTLIAELDIEQYETSPIPICVTNGWVSTNWFTFERVQFDSEIWTEISRTKYYKNESNPETTTAPIWAIEDWYCSILKKYEWTCGTSIPVWFDKYEVDAPITSAWPTTSLLDFYVAWVQTSWWDFNVINWNTFDNTITTLWTNISDVQAGINAAMIAWWFTASDAVYSVNYATNTPIIYVNPALWLPWTYIYLLCGWTSTPWTWTQKLNFNTPTTLEWAAWSDYLKVKIVCPDTPVYTKVLDWNIMPIGWWTYTFTNPVTVVTISNDTDWYVIAQFDNSLWTTWNNQIPIWAKQSYNLQANDNSLITWVTLTTSSWTSWNYLISWIRL